MERGIITITENGAVTMPTAPVWMTQQEMSDAFNVFGCYIRKAIHAIYKNGELLESETKRHVRKDGRICYDVYSLEMVIAVSFRLRSRESTVHYGQADHKRQTTHQPFLFALPVMWKESGKLNRPQTAYEIPSNGV